VNGEKNPEASAFPERFRRKELLCPSLD